MTRSILLPTAVSFALVGAFFACNSKTPSNPEDAGASRLGGAGGNAGGSTGGSSQSGGDSGGTVSTGGISGKTAGASGTGGIGGAGAGGIASGGGSATGGSDANMGGTPGGGSSGLGGATGGAAGGTTGGSQPVANCVLPKTLWTGSPSRPQLTDEAAACFTIQHYLAATGTAGALVADAWDPTAGLDVSKFPAPSITVASDGSGSHKTVQEAVDAATGTERVYILVKPGTYREPVCVKSGTPITLYGADPDASKVRIAYDNHNGKAVAGSKSNPCQIPSAATYGTTNSSSFFVTSNGFQAANLTIANEFTGSGQAVAMTSHGDKVVFQNVRFYGFQDTLQPGTPANGTVVRSYYKSCFIQGDTDFVMGAGVVVFDTCEINFIGTRKTNGCHLAPSTDGRQTYGMLIIHSRIVGGEGTKSGDAKLGRAWNNSANPNANGQVVIRDTEIDGHINSSAPWDPSTGGSKVSFDANKNRMFEYKNKGAGAAK